MGQRKWRPAFGRRSDDADEPSADGPRSSVVPVLSEGQVAALSELLRRALAERGVEVVESERPDVLTGMRGTPDDFDSSMSVGLQSLAGRVAQLPWKRWPDEVNRYADALKAGLAVNSDTAELSQLYPRLIAELPVSTATDQPQPLPGVFLLPAVDYPSGALVAGSWEHLAHLGSSSTLQQVTINNLAKLPEPEHFAIPPDAPDAAKIHTFVTDHHYGASNVLRLQDVLHHALGPIPHPHGYIVAVPNRHWMLVHIPTGPATFTAALKRMAYISNDQWTMADRGPITPDLFLLAPDGRAERIHTHAEDGSPALVLGPLMRQLHSLLG